MFNIYYLNFSKMYEISMMIDNAILQAIEKEMGKDSNNKGEAKTDIEISNSFIAKFMGSIGLNVSHSSSKSEHVKEVIQVNTTKSLLLKKIYDKAKKIESIKDLKNGALIKICDTHLEIDNIDDIILAKTMANGLFKDIKITGAEGININTLITTMVKDSSYTLTGNFNSKLNNEKFIIKIPMQVENEMESQYSISDLEISEITIIGIYKGKQSEEKLKTKLNRLMNLDNSNNKKEKEEKIEKPFVIEDSDGNDNNENNKSTEEIECHFIDVIAIIQEIRV